MKLCDGVPTLGGPQVCLGMEETYIPSCRKHYYLKTSGVVKQLPAEQKENINLKLKMDNLDYVMDKMDMETTTPNVDNKRVSKIDGKKDTALRENLNFQYSPTVQSEFSFSP